MRKHLLIQDNFFGGAKEMRKVFENRFSDSRLTSSDRFIWDYWHVPEQYTLVRTPAQKFFPPQVLEYFLVELLAWGQENLGCRAISPPWLSYYVDGCRQELHADVPHGPWAFVYSLTPWQRRKFSGGETLITKPELLNYWQNTGPRAFHERGDFFTKIPARFNRLTIFDPRLPHGVERVEGVWDPLDARLVIHGWFTEPKSYVEGALAPAKAAKAVAKWEKNLRKSAQDQQIQGVLSLRLAIGSGGSLKAIRILSDTLVGSNRAWLNSQLDALIAIEFPKAKGASQLTLPLWLRG